MIFSVHKTWEIFEKGEENYVLGKYSVSDSRIIDYDAKAVFI